MRERIRDSSSALAVGTEPARRLRLIVWTLAILLLPAMLLASRDFGATWDEPQQRAKAHHLLAYWSGTSPTLVVPIDGAHLYGAPLDVIAAALEGILPADAYVIRHAVIATAGWLGIVLCGLLADRLFGPRQALVAVLLLAACPWYLGHAMNNPKDIPFATAATGLLLALTRFRRDPPYISWKLAVVLALVIGASLNVRAGGLLFIGYIGVVVLYRVLTTGPLSGQALAQVGVRVGVVALGAIAVGWVAWPWAYAHPLAAPFLALSELGHFGWGGRVLYAGESLRAIDLPPDYVFRSFWLVLPPIVLIGLACSILTLRHPTSVASTISLWSAVLFPIVYVVGTHATLYDGVRHLFFVLPPIVVLSSAGWLAIRDAVPRGLSGAVLSLLAIGILEPGVFQWRNHPNQAAYIQPLAGGPISAYGRYDLDYWGNCMWQALERINSRTTDERTRVTGWPMIVLQADITRFPRLTLTEPNDKSADYFIRLARGNREELLRLASAAPVQPIRIATSDGALLCTAGSVDPLAGNR